MKTGHPEGVACLLDCKKHLFQLVSQLGGRGIRAIGLDILYLSNRDSFISQSYIDFAH